MATNGSEKQQSHDDLAIRLQKLEEHINGSGSTMADESQDYVHLKRKVYANPAPLGNTLQ